MQCLLLLTSMMLLAVRAGAASYDWTNTLGGDWSGLANWSPHGIPGANDLANITASGTYTVTSSNNTTFTGLTLGGSSGTQTLIYGQSSAAALLGTVNLNGVLAITNGGMQGSLTVAAGGELQLVGGYKTLYSFTLFNQGTVTWSGGQLGLSGTTVSNGGLWLITGDNSTSSGGGPLSMWVNAGTLRKSGGSGVTTLGGLNFANQPSGLVEVLAGTLQLAVANTNTFGGSFSATAPGAFKIISGIWTDAGGTAIGTGTFQFTGDTLLLRTNSIAGLTLAGGDVYIAGTFQQAGAITNLNLAGATLRGTNTVGNGTLTLTNGSAIKEQVTILPGGQLVLASSAANSYLYNATILNQGTVTWTAGSLQTGSTVVSNGGFWQIVGDLNVNYGGNAIPNWTNAGILRKTAGSGIAQFGAINFINQPGGLVDAQSGTLRFAGGALNQLGGTFNAAASSLIELIGGIWTDAGGVARGAGASRLNGATLNLRTNTIPGLQLVGGSVYVTGATTFQQAGAITNLTLDGAALGGTNSVGNGTLTLNSGSIAGWLTVNPNGLLVFATSGNKTLTGCSLFNNGTVWWSGGAGIGVGNTLFSNGGLWQIAGDYAFSYSGGLAPVWTNSGTLEKTAGAGIASLASLNFYNQANGLVQVDSGTLRLNSTTTNSLGTLRLNGGKLDANGTLAFGGGTLDGSGAVGPNALTGGLISPGLGGPGLMSFASDLNLGSNANLMLDGTGVVPGAGYDQLSVTGAVVLGNCALQVNALPELAPDTTFVIIINDGSDPVSGTFKGFPENAMLAAGRQLFRISYHGGTGNDVVLTRLSNNNAQPLFGGVARLGNGSIQCGGTGGAGLTYTVLANPDVTTTNWIPLGSAWADALGNLSFTDPAATNFPARFYRFVWL